MPAPRKAAALSRTLVRILTLILLAAGALTATAFAIHRLWPRKLQINVPRPNLEWAVDSTNRMTVRVPGAQLIAVISEFPDELYAYLMFDFIRTRPAVAGHEALLI